jgi:hypothetical protein
MPPRIGTILTTALATGALACSLALAGPRPQPPAAPVPPLLTATERLCGAYAQFAYDRAVERDQGASLIATLQRVRAYDLANRAGADVTERHIRIGCSPETDTSLVH